MLSAGLSTSFPDSSSEVSASSPWGYFSKRLDPDLGLIDFGKRWYDPEQARWTTLDPAGFIDGINLYRFVKNNPLLYTDPDGQFAIAIPLFHITSAAITWFCSTETFIAITAAAAAVYGTYKACEYIDNSLDARREARAERQHYGPLYATNTEYKPTTDAEEEEDPEWNNGSGQNEGKIGTGKFERYEKNRGISQAGSRRAPLDPAKCQSGRNVATKINGREYTGHALDRMQERGYMPTVVENGINTGHRLVRSSKETRYYDPLNDFTTVVGEEGQIITVFPGD